MSLELALQENTRAMLALTEILTKGLGATIVSPDALEDQVLPKALPAESTKTIRTRAKKEAEAPAPKDNAAVEGDEAETKVAEPVTRDQVSKTLTRLASKKGREAAMAVLTAIGCKTLGDVDPASYAELLADCEKALA